MSQTDLFTTRMRKATRKIHSVSDALVNAKFAISLRDEDVWGGGLFVFYHIFAYLEDAQKRLNMPDLDHLFVNKIMFRKHAFEEDLAHYLGENWRSKTKSLALDNYLEHLQNLERENPELLLAYVYHLYLGLLSGGQILAKKRTMFGEIQGYKELYDLQDPRYGDQQRRITFARKYGNELRCDVTCSGPLRLVSVCSSLKENPAKEKYVDKVTDFNGVDIAQLKVDMRKAMNDIAEKMSEDEQQAFIEESNQVFLMNNLIVNSISGQNKVLYNILYKTSAIVVLVIGVILVYKVHK